MFERFSQSLGSFFSDHHARDEYLSSSSDLAELERRMREVETQDHMYNMHFYSSSGGRHYDDH
ncbi:hypothetical protein AWB71_05367 [Caballeronia peredens]|nr:hypothetical protein AWB71_05367 [Caballeronia peredens]